MAFQRMSNIKGMDRKAKWSFKTREVEMYYNKPAHASKEPQPSTLPSIRHLQHLPLTLRQRLRKRLELGKLLRHMILAVQDGLSMQCHVVRELFASVTNGVNRFGASASGRAAVGSARKSARTADRCFTHSTRSDSSSDSRRNSSCWLDMDMALTSFSSLATRA